MRRILWAIAVVMAWPTAAFAQPKASIPPSQLVTVQASQVAGIANATTTRQTTTGLDPYVDANCLLNITAGGTATGTLQIYVQDSQDGGTTWDDLMSSLTFSFGAAAVTQRFVISGRVVPATITTAASTNITQGSAVSVEALAAGSARQGPFGPRLRVREKVSGASGSPVGPTYAITCTMRR
jgi:hypothetical protein